MILSRLRVLAFCKLMLVIATIAGAAVPQMIAYQGRLTGSTGTPFTGAKLMKFTLYNSSSVAVWNSGFISVTCTDGLFSVNLGDAGQPALPASIFTDPGTSLGITVDVDPEISPRTKLTSQAYAYRSLNADTAFAAHSLFANTVGSSEIINGSIAFADIGQNGAAANQVIKWNGTAWTAADDAVGGPAGPYLPLAGGTMTGPIMNSGDPSITMGKGNFGTGNSNAGSNAFVAGMANNASGVLASITGGSGNTASGYSSTISGGVSNSATQDYAVVAGGWHNLAGGTYSYAAGIYDTASGSASAVLGGGNNTASNYASTVIGGANNKASGQFSIAGGFYNFANSDGSIAIGYNNTASSQYATVVGGQVNAAGGDFSSILGGQGNTASGIDAVVAGGAVNTALGMGSIVAGGSGNKAIGNKSFVTGENDTAGGNFSTVMGGEKNAASGVYASIAGGRDNKAYGHFSTIGGGEIDTTMGYYSTVAGGIANVALDSAAAVCGGNGNRATGMYSFIGGGGGIPLTDANNASGRNSAITGGSSNIASGDWSAIPGGGGNEATGMFSYAAGHFAHAVHDGSFVLADNVGSGIYSQYDNEFSIRAVGGTRIYSSWPPGPITGVFLAPGAGAWASISDSTAKCNIRPVDGAELLARLEKLPVSRWSYKSQDPNIEHIGPMAQDFYALFGVGESDTTISTIDPSGIALAAIKELAKRNENLQAEVEQLKKQVQFLMEHVNAPSDNNNEKILSSK
jgi:trimeric autotransporter adhesin